MDNKVINKYIQKVIWTILKEHGFSKFTSRNAWRYNQYTIDVINFQSFNSFIAGYIGCTTFSFSINLGKYFIMIPNQYPNRPVKEKDGLLLPEEYRCIFRKHLIKSLTQEDIKGKHIWYIDDKGDNIEMVMDDVEKILISDGLKWLDKYSRIDVALETLLNEEEDLNGTWGFGRKGSPVRNFAGGYISYFLQKYDRAVEMLDKAIKSGCFDAIDERLQQDFNRAKEMST